MRSTVAESILEGIQLAAGSRLEDSDRLTSIAARKEQILASRLQRDQSAELFPAQLQKARSDAATSTLTLADTPVRLQQEADQRDLALKESRFKVKNQAAVYEQDRLGKAAEIEGKKAITAGQNIKNRTDSFAQNEAELAVYAGRTLDSLINLAGDTVSFTDGRVKLDGVTLLKMQPGIAADLINYNERYFSTINADGEEESVRITGFDQVQETENGPIGYIPKVAARGATKSAPLTKGGTAAPGDKPAIFSAEDVNQFFTNAFVGASSVGASNSKAFQTEGYQRIGRAASEQGIINEVGSRLRAEVANSPLPENAQRAFGQAVNKAIADEDMEALAALAETTGLSKIYDIELAAQAEAFDEDYVQKRMQSNNPRYADPITSDLTNEVDVDPSLVRATGAASSGLDEKLAEKSKQNIATVKQRMQVAGLTYPEFTANFQQLGAALKAGNKVLNPEQEEEIKALLDEELEPGESLNPESFVRVIQKQPDVASGMMTFFAQGSEDPIKDLEAMDNLLKRGNVAYTAAAGADDNQARTEFLQEQADKLRELGETNTDAIINISEEINAHITSQDFSASGTLNPEASAKFKANLTRIIDRASRAGGGRTATGKKVALDTIADVLRESMLQNGSLGTSGSAADFFYRRRGPQQLLGDRFERLVISSDGSKIGFEDPSGGDVVFAGELSVGQLEARFGETQTKKILKLITKTARF